MSDEKLFRVLSALPNPVILIGADARIVAANAASQKVFGPGLEGRHFITAIRQPAVIQAIADVRQKAAMTSVEFIQRDEATDIHYRVAVAPADENVVLSFEDQTAAQEVGQMRRDFVANVSHELRTPLTALLGFIETLGGAAKDDPDARDRFLKIMAHEAQRMTRLVDDLLSLSRVEEEERIRPSTPVHLGALLSSVLKGLEPQVEAAEVAIEFERPDAAGTVPGDHNQLAQVFSNLIENALKYGASGGVVRIQVAPVAPDPRLRTDAIAVSVSDQGEGIADYHLARLTERFYRVDSHRSRSVGGTGLGLAIVKHIMNRHRGRLTIESKLQEGTTVTVFLPVGGLS